MCKLCLSVIRNLGRYEQNAMITEKLLQGI